MYPKHAKNNTLLFTIIGLAHGSSETIEMTGQVSFSVSGSDCGAPGFPVIQYMCGRVTVDASANETDGHENCRSALY